LFVRVMELWKMFFPMSRVSPSITKVGILYYKINDVGVCTVRSNGSKLDECISC